jgi:hypothetical protein
MSLGDETGLPESRKVKFCANLEAMVIYLTFRLMPKEPGNGEKHTENK